MELMCDDIYKARSRNPNRLIDMKAKVLSLPRAMKVSDLDRVLAELKYVLRQIAEEDPAYKLDDETLQTLLVQIIPNDLVKAMRELLT